MPYYPGGEEAMIAFINKSIKYPRLEKRKKIEGKVVALIIINQDGSVSDIRVKKQVSPNIDKEAIRVISLLKFNPGIEAGKPVRVQFAIPIYFKL
jgi:protein TonB